MKIFAETQQKVGKLKNTKFLEMVYFYKLFKTRKFHCKTAIFDENGPYFAILHSFYDHLDKIFAFSAKNVEFLIKIGEKFAKFSKNSTNFRETQ